jgi:hypothetical protein
LELFSPRTWHVYQVCELDAQGRGEPACSPASPSSPHPSALCTQHLELGTRNFELFSPHCSLLIARSAATTAAALFFTLAALSEGAAPAFYDDRIGYSRMKALAVGGSAPREAITS